VLDDAQWYVGALSTWCAAAFACSANEDMMSLRCVLIDTPCVTGFRKTADLTHASHLADVKQSPTSDNYLLHCVCSFLSALPFLGVNEITRLPPVHVKP
jgi:hypothetical protein